MMHAAVYPYTTHYLTLTNGCRIAYIDEGKGETLLFVHGLATYALSWKKNIDDLKDHYRCIAIDLPGNGLSDRGDYAYNIGFFAEMVYDFIQKAGLKNVSVIAHSMGGQITAAMLAKEPAAATRLVLCAPAGFETFTPAERNLYHTSLQLYGYLSTEESSLRKSIRASFYHMPTQADEMAEELAMLLRHYPLHLYRKMMEGCIWGMLHEPVFDSLHLIEQPTLVIFGEEDALIPNKILHPTTTRHIAEQGTQQIPYATLQMIAQCGHFVQWEKADEVNHHIRQFIG